MFLFFRVFKQKMNLLEFTRFFLNLSLHISFLWLFYSLFSLFISSISSAAFAVAFWKFGMQDSVNSSNFRDDTQCSDTVTCLGIYIKNNYNMNFLCHLSPFLVMQLKHKDSRRSFSGCYRASWVWKIISAFCRSRGNGET